MSEILLIRHAQASFRSVHYDRLSDLGVRQAGILGDYFARIGVRPDAVYSGTLKRQAHTARTALARVFRDGDRPEARVAAEFDECEIPITSQLPELLRADPSLAEAVVTMATDARSFHRVLEKAMARWMAGETGVPGRETWRDFARRARAGIDRAIAENGRGKRVAVFTSGGTIAAILQSVLGLADEAALPLALQVPNTSVSVVRYGGGRLSLRSFNSIAHLVERGERGLVTYL